MNDSIPIVPGFRLERDPLTRQWIATSPSGYKIRGWTQRELDDARWGLWSQLLADFRVAIAEVYPRYTSRQDSRPVRPVPGCVRQISRQAGGDEMGPEEAAGGAARSCITSSPDAVHARINQLEKADCT